MITKLKYCNTNTFFIRGTSGNVLIDTDYAGTLPSFYKEIKKYNIEIGDISYVLATHYHPDHMGLVSELMEMGVNLLLIDTQVEYVHFSDEIFRRDNRRQYTPINEKESCLITCEESRKLLHGMGIEGEIISTPSHSKDSISLILDDGTCFVGDLEPIDYLDAYDDNAGLKEDWERIMSYKPKVIYYAHVNERKVNEESPDIV